ncbi:MAG: MmgE/PrpD family protein, partial [Deltaproteobacteria bacterium]|nr:MmgE/PrpD family protein [Deltaproteobacteria bacterium]
MEHVTNRLAEFIARLTYGQIPGKVIENVKKCLLDSLGCAIFGSSFKWAK